MVAETVYEEIALGPANLGLPRGEVMERTDEALEALTLEELAGRDPRYLSGGQQQLVVLAGLLAIRAQHLVLDEPLAHLDARSTDLVMAALAKVAATGTVVLIVEQRSDVLAEHCSTIGVMAAGNLVHFGETAQVLADTSVLALGVREPQQQRLRRLLSEAD